MEAEILERFPAFWQPRWR